MAGRIEGYMHSDSITKNKGGCLIRVTCDTDFAANTKEFTVFCAAAVRFCYAVDSALWSDVATAYPDIEAIRLDTEEALKERITVTTITILKL